MRMLHQFAFWLVLSTLVYGTPTVQAQSITLNSTSATAFCAGDPVSATFTATGSWGQYNAFTLQLSDPSGSFDHGFTNLGSVKDSAAGSFTIVSTIPVNETYSSHYRVRILGAIPYVTSPDNGADIVIGEHPTHVVWRGHILETAVAAETPISFQLQQDENQQGGNNIDTEYIDYGPGAIPPNRTIMSNILLGDYPVKYVFGGLKTIRIRSVAAGGCSVSDSFQARVFDCNILAIPKDAIIISSDTTMTDGDMGKAYWVNPGVSLTVGREIYDTIFAEAGARISGQNGGQTANVDYLKPGSQSDPNFDGVTIYAPGASVADGGKSCRTLECTTLSFDYSQAPPNTAMHINDAVTTVAAVLPPITSSPNPTTGTLVLSGVPDQAAVTVQSILGVVLMKTDNSHAASLTLDLSTLPRGTYYVRIASQNGVVTKKIVKE